jgi:hypothetical protein
MCCSTVRSTARNTCIEAGPVTHYEQKLKKQSVVITGKRSYELNLSRGQTATARRPCSSPSPASHQSKHRAAEPSCDVKVETSTNHGSQGRHRRSGWHNVQH